MAKILIIGAGAAGLSAGIFARLSGMETVICEKESDAGGCLACWERGGYRIDNCIHWLTGTNPKTEFYRKWETLGVLGGDVPVIRPDSLYTSEWNGRRLSLRRDREKLEREMILLSPVDEKEIRRFFGAVKALQKICAGVEERMAPGEWVRALLALSVFERETTGKTAGRFSHPLIRRFLTDLLTENFSTLALLFVFAHFFSGNADLPQGGSFAALSRMKERYLSLGGRLLTKTKIVRLREKEKGVAAMTEKGELITGDAAILTPDPAAVFPELLEKPVPAAFQRRLDSEKRFRFSACHAAFGVDAPSLPFQNDLVLPLSGRAAQRLGAKRLILREFSHEPSFSPAGKSLLQAFLFCDERRSRYFLSLRRSPEAYRAEKQSFAEACEEALCRRFPELNGKTQLLDVWTPATYHRYLGSETGSFMGFAFSGGVIPKKLSPAVPGCRHIFLAGQWIEEPGGLPIAVQSGERAVERILKEAEEKSGAFRSLSAKKTSPQGI